MKPSFTFKASRGFTLIELMVAVAIIAVAIIAILGRVNSTRQASNVQTETSNIQTIMNATQQAFAAQPNFGLLNNSVLQAANGFPTQMINSGGITNIWGGTVTVGPQSIPGANVAKGQIDYTSVPTGSCIALTNAIARNVDAIYIEGAPVKQSGATVTTADQIQAACESNGGSPTVSVVFTN